MFLARCAVKATSRPSRSAVSFSMPRSRRSSASATQSRAPCRAAYPDLDKLVVEIETNSAVSAEDAVRASAKVLVEQLAVFARLEGSELAAFDAPAPRGNTQFDPILLRPVKTNSN